LYFYRKRNESEIDFVLQSNWKLIPIEVKTSDKDNIPKIFESFCKKYSEKIKFFVKTSKTLQKQRNLWDCIVKILPYIKIVEVLED
jgi:predicted AAA+ superfamily ATPase